MVEMGKLTSKLCHQSSTSASRSEDGVATYADDSTRTCHLPTAAATSSKLLALVTSAEWTAILGWPTVETNFTVS